MKQKSITKNTLVYVIKVISSMIFPLITFPYVSRVLSPEGIGQYTFSTSYVSYFSLIAALGISTYAIREGAKIRDDKEKFNRFASEVFTLNLFSSFVAYAILGITLIFVPKLWAYSQIILVLSGTVILTTIGTEWICSVYEDYVFITIRSVIFQAISLMLMFLFVKEPQDVGKYALITVLANAGSNLTNWGYVRRYYNHRLCFTKKIIDHLKPVLVLFSSAIASQIYVNSDTVMLGFMKTDYEVGIYGAATKIYNIVRTVIAAFITVLSPRMVYLYGKKDKTEYKQWMKQCVEGFFAVVFACAVGVFCVAEEVIVFLCGTEYVDAVKSLMVLAIALIFSLMGGFVANEVLLVANKEKKILFATSLGAVVNIAANFIMIPLWGHFGAALTTLFSEIVVFSVQLYYSLDIVHVRKWFGNFVKVCLSSAPFWFICNYWNHMEIAVVLKLIGSVVCCVFTYAICMIILKHDIVKTVFGKIRRTKHGI